MNYNEMSQQLTEDLEIIVNAKHHARNPDQLLGNMSLFASDYRDHDLSIAESWVSITCYQSLPHEIKRLVSMLKISPGLIDIAADEGINLEKLLLVVQENQELIRNNIKELIEKEQIVFVAADDVITPLKDLLVKELNDLHEEAVNLQNCVNEVIK